MDTVVAPPARPVQPKAPFMAPLVDRVRDSALRHRAAANLPGPRRITVVSLKGGSGRSTVTLGLGDVLAAERDTPVAALDAVPLRGGLAAFAGGRSPASVMDLLANYQSLVRHDSPAPPAFVRPSGLSVLTSENRLDARYVLGADGYRWLAGQLMPRHYALTITDTPAVLSDPRMAAVLPLSDLLVLTTTASAESATLANDALNWLGLNGYDRLASSTVLVVNGVRDGDPGVPVDTITAYFTGRVAGVITVPWDAHLAAGGAIDTRQLAPATRTSYLMLAALTVSALVNRTSK